MHRIISSKTFNPWNYEIFPNASSTTDKMGIPDDWHDTISLCNFFYERDGMIRTVIDKQVEIAINDILIVNEGELSSREAPFFDYIKNSISGFLAQAATEYYISGLVIPEIVWETLYKDESGLKKDYITPADLWTRDPLHIELKRTPLPNRVVPLWKLTQDEIYFIQNKGVFQDGTEDKETYEILKISSPEFVKLINKGKTKLPLSDTYIIRRKPLLRSEYPIPYIMPALELLMHKRNLRKMDYALAARVINSILQFKVGDKDFPLKEDDEDILNDLEREIRNRGSVNNQERIIELFTNHTVEIKWISPDINALLNTDRYTELNQEILYALGFPKFLLTGEKDKSNTGSTSSALLSPLNSMKAMRRDFEDFLNYMFRQICDKNGIKKVPRVKFAPLNLIDLTELVSIAQTLADKDIVSYTSVSKLAGFDFTSEQYLKKQELALQENLFGDLTDENEEQDNNQ